jgi:hypothetical protein
MQTRFTMTGFFCALLLLRVSAAQSAEQPLTREQWGAPLVQVSHTDGRWTITGKQQTVVLTQSNLALEVRAGTAVWNMVASGTNDMVVQSAGKAFPLRLADAGKTDIKAYDTGFKTGVKITLSDWRHGGEKVGFKLHLTYCRREELGGMSFLAFIDRAANHF